MINLEAGIKNYVVTFNPAPDLDVVGYVINASLESGFTPSASNVVSVGPDTSVTIPSDDGVYYVKVAAYDSFEDPENIDFLSLNYSEEKSVEVRSIPDIIEMISGQITESELHSELSSRIDLIDSPEVGLLDRLAQEILDRAAAVSGEAQARAAALDYYYTKVEADTAIAEAVIGASSGSVTNDSLATALSGYYTKTEADSATATAITGATSSLVSTDSLATSLASYYTKVDTDSAIATATSGAVATANNNTASALINYSTTVETTTAIDGAITSAVEAKMMLKVDANGKIAGIGLWSDGVTSNVEILADRFSIVDAGPGATPLVPFIVDQGTVYIAKAAIKDGDIDNAKIGNYIQSTNYVAGQAGWKFDKTGTFQLKGGDFYGTVHFTSAPKDANGNTIEIDNNAIVVGGRNILANSDFSSGTTPWALYNNGPEAASLVLVTGAGRNGTNALRVSFSSNTSQKGIKYYVNTGWQPNTTYTISFYSRTDNIATAVPMSLRWNVNPVETEVVANPVINTSWQRYVFIVRWGVNVDTYGPYISIAGSTSGQVDFSCVMAEEGNKASAWTPSIEDINESIAAALNEAEAANALIAEIASDGKLTATEKQSVRLEWDVVASEWGGINTQAENFGITTEKSNYINAFQALANYLNNGVAWSSGVPSWITDVNIPTTTTIVGATFRSKWSTYYYNRTILLNAIATKAKTVADTANSTANTAASTATTAATNATNAVNTANTVNSLVSDIASDSKLTPNEKYTVRREWEVVAAEKAGIETQATSFGLVTEKATYTTAFQNLANYLNAGVTWASGIPSWISDANASITTTIVGSTFRATWKAYYDARTALLNAVAVKAASMANSTEDNLTTIARPVGGTYSITGSATGAIKITLPVLWSGTMLQFSVDVYNYTTNQYFTALVGGYTSAGGYWVNTSASIVGQSSASHTIRFGHDGTKACVWIGETNSSWAHPKVVVKNFIAGYSNYDIDTWKAGWDVSVVTSFGTVQVTDTDNMVYASDVAKVGGTLAATVRDNAASAATTLADWTRPGTTTIDGNKIYTGDAYVDTLQIKGQAVTISVGASAASELLTNSSTWADTGLEASITLEAGTPVMVSVVADGDIKQGVNGGYWDQSVYVRVLRGATAITGGEETEVGTWAVTLVQMSETGYATEAGWSKTGIFLIKDTPGAGTFTYKLQYRAKYALGAASARIRRRGITILAVKR